MLKVAITGGIGSGKSYVCEFFKHLGVPIFNTDDFVKFELIRSSSIKSQMIAEFGDDSYLSDGSLNRNKFLNILFDDKQSLDFVNRLVSPYLIKEIHNWSDKQKSDYVLVECACLFENNLQEHFHEIITVTCELKTRIERLIDRGVSRENIDKIMKVQWSDEDKIAKCTWGLLNDESVNVYQEVLKMDEFFKRLAKHID